MFHNRTHTFTRAVLLGGLLSLAGTVEANQAAAKQPVQAQQTQQTPDSELAAKIRQALADDKALAGYAQTLKIIVSDGTVSLKGAVKSDADKKAVGEKADKIAGAPNVMNNLIVAPSQADASKPPTR